MTPVGTDDERMVYGASRMLHDSGHIRPMANAANPSGNDSVGGYLDYDAKTERSYGPYN